MGHVYATEAVDQLRLTQGQWLYGDGALVAMKALLESGISYLGGYPGAPVSNLTDVAEDALPLLQEMGIFYARNTNEAAAAALLKASINHPVRGAVSWKVVGTNVAADVLAHIASSGVRGGCVIFVGEDYGCTSTTVAEKSLSYGVHLSMPVLDPRCDSEHLAHLVRHAFPLSEACSMPVLFVVRTRVGNMAGAMRTLDSHPPAISTKQPLQAIVQTPETVPLPPFSQVQEKDKAQRRLPAAESYIEANHLNELIPGEADGKRGIISHGLVTDLVLRGLERLGEADTTGRSRIPILSLHALHPLASRQLAEFLADKEDVVIFEEGIPPLLEDGIRSLAHKRGISARLLGNGLLPEAGEYTPDVVLAGLEAFLARGTRVYAPAFKPRQETQHPLPQRPPLFCAGCPERPVFSAIKLFQKTHNIEFEYAGDISCAVLATYPPFEVLGSITGMGTGLAASLALSKLSKQKTVYVVGDGTTWAQALTTSIANAQLNFQDAIVIVLENFWTAMTGHQPNPSSRLGPGGNPLMDIEKTLRAMGQTWLRVVSPYDFGHALRTLEEAYRDNSPRLKIIISRAECELEKQRRVRRFREKRLRDGKRIAVRRLGVDAEVCAGDKSCIGYSGCPSMGISENPNPLRRGSVAQIDSGCTGCQLCGEIAETAHLCPSFYETLRVKNPTPWERLRRAIESLFVPSLRPSADHNGDPLEPERHER
jgi:indolepyruvate ferredoxin oxidoreductase alpha subunit